MNNGGGGKRIHQMTSIKDHPLKAAPRSWQLWMLSSLAAVMPLSFSIDLGIKAIPPGLLFLTGLALLVGSKDTLRAFRVARSPVIAALLMVGFVIFNVLIHQLDWRPLDRPGHILLFLVTAACFVLPLRMRLVWAGFSLTAIALGGVCVLQRNLWGIDRAYGLNGGPSASITLATILLGLSAMSLTQFLASGRRRYERILHLAGMALGMYGALLSQSRGPLLAFVPVFALLVLLHAKRTGHWRSSILIVAAVCVIASLAMISLRGEIKARFEAITPELTTFDHQHDAQGAVRERLEMWRTAALAVAAHPILGIGMDKFGDYVHQEITAGRTNPIIAGYNQPHNEYLNVAATGGLPGLFVLLGVFLVPLCYFSHRILDPNDDIALPASIGMAIIVLYMLCALTDGVFYRTMTQSFYYFIVLGMALLTARHEQHRSPSIKMG